MHISRSCVDVQILSDFVTGGSGTPTLRPSSWFHLLYHVHNVVHCSGHVGVLEPTCIRSQMTVSDRDC
jgi:hypothetical protein